MVSAIITTHNRLNVLPRAIESVFNQTYCNIELIVVSDGSSDGTDEYMKQYEDNLRVKYISYFPSRGGNYARNKGILAARGNYIAFLDDDDEWHPQKISKQIAKIIEDNSIGLVYVGKNIIYPKKKISYKSIPPEIFNARHNILIDNFIGTTSSVLVKRDIVVACGMFDEKLKALQDHDLWIRVCQLCSIAMVGEPLLNYYNYPNVNQISDKTSLYEECRRYIENKYKDLYNSLSENEYLRYELTNLLEQALRCQRNGLKKKSRYYLKLAFKKERRFKTIVLILLSFMPFNFNLCLRKYKSIIGSATLFKRLY